MKKIIFVLVLVSFQLSFSQNWVRKLDGYSMWSLGKDYSGNIYAGVSGTPRNIFKSSNGGNSWDTVLTNGASNFLYIACDSLTNVYAANVSNGVMKSSNGGINWINIPSSVFGGQNVNSIACSRNGYVFVGATLGGIYRSTDYGANFTQTALSGLTIVTIAVDRFNSNIIYAGASSGSPPNYGFYRSTDGGLTFSSNLNPLNIWGIAEKLNGNLYTVTTSSPYPLSKSTDGGLNWVNVSNLSGAMRGMCLDLAENIYTAGNGGVWKSTNDGVSFANHNLTFSSNQVISFQNKILVAVSGTANGGVYIFTDSLVGISKNENKTPDRFSLHQNYPNPFNPVTKIRFEIPLLRGVDAEGERGVSVKLIIFDILGREVTTLVNEPLKPGTYEVDWSATGGGTNYPSGIYFYKLTTKEFSETKRMVLIK
jgi:hypothetical protein